MASYNIQLVRKEQRGRRRSEDGEAAGREEHVPRSVLKSY